MVRPRPGVAGRLAAASALLALLLGAAPAGARSDQYTETRAPVRWRRAAIAFTVDPSLYDAAALPRPAEVVGRAAATWQAMPAAPRIALRAGALGDLGYDPRRADNASGIALYRQSFPRRMATPALALTLATRNVDTGEILDADVILDAERFRFAVLSPAGMVGAAGAPHDYQSVIAHELGHVLGLTEDPTTPGAVMYPTTRPGEATRRALHAEDEASIRTVYGFAEGADDRAPGGPALLEAGCGGAHVAPTDGLRGGRALCLVALGLLGLAAARSRWRRRWVVFAGGAMLAVGAPTPGAATEATAIVLDATSRYEGGVIVTRARLATGGVVREVEALGGRVGDVEQVLHDAPSGADLRPGARVPAAAFGAE